MKNIQDAQNIRHALAHIQRAEELASAHAFGVPIFNKRKTARKTVKEKLERMLFRRSEEEDHEQDHCKLEVKTLQTLGPYEYVIRYKGDELEPRNTGKQESGSPFRMFHDTDKYRFWIYDIYDAYAAQVFDYGGKDSYQIALLDIDLIAFFDRKKLRNPYISALDVHCRSQNAMDV